MKLGIIIMEPDKGCTSVGWISVRVPLRCTARIIRSCRIIAASAAPEKFFARLCRFQRGLKRKPMALIKKLRKAVRSS